MRLLLLFLRLLFVFGVAFGNARSGQAQTSPLPAPTASPTPAIEAGKIEAKLHFERGVGLLREESFDAALAEFMRSRELFANRSNTQNAALCLTKLKRFHEALSMLESVVREFPPATVVDRQGVEQEIEKLRTRVGFIDVRVDAPGATVVVDQREQGASPLSVPLRVSAGTHTLRIYKEGYNAFEARVSVAGKQTAIVDARLSMLTQSGRLRVVESSQQNAIVYVDNVRVGEAPWEGPLGIGSHLVTLHGPGNLGTQPASAPVRDHELTVLTVALEPLDSHLRVDPTPAHATVAVDGVTLGRGVWEGRMHAGHHRVEVASEGFLSFSQTMVLQPNHLARISPVLERDRTSPLWKDAPASHVFVDAMLGGAGSFSLGGDVAGGCAGACGASLPLGARVITQAGYQWGSGLGAAASAGYLQLNQTVKNRTTELVPLGKSPNPGTSRDSLQLQGFSLGGAGSITRGTSWKWTLQLGGGIFLASVKDQRSGTFTTVANAASSGITYDVSERSETATGSFLYVAPAARVSLPLGKHLEVGVGLEVLWLHVLTHARWADTRPVVTGTCVAQPSPNCVTDGQAFFGRQNLLANDLAIFSPGITGRYLF